MKIVYMGTPDFAVAPLRAMAENGFNISLVVTQPDKARDRGKRVQPTPVKEAALSYGLDVAQPEKIKGNDEFLERLRHIAPDLIVVAAYGKILPKELLEIPRLGCVNIHASLLPRFRGAAPIQRSIIEGDEETGITLMYMAEGLDTGDMIAKSFTKIGRKDADMLHDELSQMGAQLLIEYLPKIESGDISPEKQDDSLSCYAPMLEKSEGNIDFSQSAEKIDRIVRGMGSWPGVTVDYDGKRMKIKEAYPLMGDTQGDMSTQEDSAGEQEDSAGMQGDSAGEQEDSAGMHGDGADVQGNSANEKDGTDVHAVPGTILSADKRGIRIACESGVLVVTKLQMPGKKAMNAADYLRGNSIEVGTVLKKVE